MIIYLVFLTTTICFGTQGQGMCELREELRITYIDNYASASIRLCPEKSELKRKQ